MNRRGSRCLSRAASINEIGHLDEMKRGQRPANRRNRPRRSGKVGRRDGGTGMRMDKKTDVVWVTREDLDRMFRPRWGRLWVTAVLGVAAAQVVKHLLL